MVHSHASRRSRPHRKLTFEPLDCRRMLAGNVFHYAADPFDVNMDGQHSTADLRVVVLDLMENGARTLQANDDTAAHYRVDVSGDDMLNSQDVRMVFAMLTAADETAADPLQDVVAEVPLVTSEIYIAEGMGGGMNMGGDALADFQSLIDLIRNTIPPEAWNVAGTEMRLMEVEENVSLIIRQTQEVQDEIADLLSQLRALQDLQVTVDVRFITLTDNFFESIGIDFDFDFDFDIGDNSQPGQTPPGPNVSIGLDPNGNPIVDFDLPFLQESFNIPLPPFGDFDSTGAANLGFAILSDIEAFFFLQAAQGDARANLLQAPAVTLFNGQLAQVIDNIQRPFVTSVTPVVGGSSVGFVPVIAELNEGTLLNVEANISSDQRYIRLTVSPLFGAISQIDFSFEATTTVQLPTFAFTEISTTVSVPDGGTILLGGIKRLAEARNEAGVPLLNQLPYINRLFKNVSISRDNFNLMLMVTPRIIIQEEE